MVEETEREIGAAYGRLVAAVNVVRSLHESYLDDLHVDHDRQRPGPEHDLTSQRHAVDEAQYAGPDGLGNERSRAGSDFATQVAKIIASHPWATAPFNDPVWANFQPEAQDTLGGEVRIGRLDFGAEARGMPNVPALVPLLGDGHILIHASGDTLLAAREFLATVVLRLITSTAPGSVRLALADPVGHGRHLSAFLRLPPLTRVGNQVAVTGSDLETMLSTLAEHVVDVTQTRLTNVYDTIEDYNTSTTGVAVPYHLLVISDLPAGMTERAADRLIGLARNGPRAGVYIVALADGSAEMPRGFELADLGNVHHLRYIDGDKLRWDDPEFAEYRVTPDAAPTAERSNAWLDAVGAAISQLSDRLPFDRIVVPALDHWTGNSTNGLEVQIGVDARGEPHRLTIGRGAVHHALVGGDVQMGKSNLLQVIITQLALRYPPEELELYLLDFKQVEFHSYLTHGLPHARAIASHADREFGLSVLRRFRTEIDRRSALFQQADVEHLRDYRRRTGELLPRALVVMDEFQALFPDHDQLSTSAGFMLEDIAKRGAAFGLHLLMCSQAPTSGQVATYLRPMYEQMGLRIALGCQSPNVSYAILGEGNDAATKLRRPGEAVYNNRGGAGHNPTVRIAELPGHERREWLKTLNSLAGDREFTPPATFHPTTPAYLIENPACAALLTGSKWPAASPSVQAWLGEPVEITAATTATFERYPGSNLMLIADEQAGHALLLSSLLSVAVQRAPADACFVVAEFARPTSSFHGFFVQIADQLPHSLLVAGPRGAAAALDDLVETMANRAEAPSGPHPELFFFVAGMHRWRELAPDGRFGERSQVAQQLAHLADEGPELGIHIVAWADSYATLERALQRGVLNLFDQRAVLRTPSDTDSMALLGTPAAAKLPDNRALYRIADWEAGRVEKFKPYSLPDLKPFEGLKTRVSSSASQASAAK